MKSLLTLRFPEDDEEEEEEKLTADITSPIESIHQVNEDTAPKAIDQVEKVRSLYPSSTTLFIVFYWGQIKSILGVECSKKGQVS